MIPWFKPNFWGNEKKYTLDALNSTWISDGEYICRFEKDFALSLRANSSITVSNGTTALYLAFLAYNIGLGDEVIIPGYTFAAPANMTMATGATPKFVDVHPETWLLDPNLIEAAITPRTKAIVAVHTYGNVCEMQKLRELADKYKLILIEDVAEAAFSMQKGRYAGTFGEVGCFSFQATKTLTMGEGGAVVLSNDLIEKRARLLRSHGMEPGKPYLHSEIGHNFRLTNMQAALGCAQLEKLTEIIKEKNRVYERYLNNFISLEGVVTQKITDKTTPVMWAIAILINSEKYSVSRDEIRLILLEKGIETRPGFYSFNQMSLYQQHNTPVSDYLAKNIMSLPSYPTLKNVEIDEICELLYKLRAPIYV